MTELNWPLPHTTELEAMNRADMELTSVPDDGEIEAILREWGKREKERLDL